MAIDINGILQAVSLGVGVETYVPLQAYMREVFINEAPLLMRLPRAKAEAETYNIVTYDNRPRKYTLNAAVLAGDATMTLVDATPLMPGDVLQMFATGGATTERIEVLSMNKPNGLIGATVNGTTINIRRAVEGTTARANDNTGNKTLTLVGNSRTGAEIMQEGARAVRTAISQNVQTSQYSVTMGGKVQAIGNAVLPNGVTDIFNLEQRTKATDFVRDVEYSMYYGLGDTPVAPGDRAKMSGLRRLIGYYQNGANVKLAAGASYLRNTLINDTIYRALAGGGNPDMLLCSIDFLGFIATWTNSNQFITSGTTQLGVPIKSFTSAFTGGPLEIVPSYQLEPGTAICMTSSDLRVRYLREEGWIARATIGDARMGDFIGDFAIELGHPGFHSWVEGIQSAA